MLYGVGLTLPYKMVCYGKKACQSKIFLDSLTDFSVFVHYTSNIIVGNTIEVTSFTVREVFKNYKKK